MKKPILVYLYLIVWFKYLNGVLYFFGGAFYGIFKTAFSALQRLKNALSNFITAYFVNKVQIQIFVLFLYYTFFASKNFYAFSITSLFFFFFLLLSYSIFIIFMEKKIGFQGIFVWLYVYITYYVAWLLHFKQLDPKHLIVFCVYCAVYITINLFVTKVMKSQDNIQFHYDHEFKLFKNVRKFILIFLTILGPIFQQIPFTFFLNYLIAEITSLIVFFILITLLFLSLIDLTIVLLCNPQTKGLFMVCKTCAGVGVLYMGTISVTGLAPIFPTSNLPLEAYIQAQTFGMVLPSLRHKAIYYKLLYIFPSELDNLKILPDNSMDLKAAETAFENRCLKDAEKLAKVAGSAATAGAISEVKIQASPWYWFNAKK